MAEETVGIRLTADGTAFIGAVKLSREEIEKLAEASDKAAKSIKNLNVANNSVAKETGELGVVAKVASTTIGALTLASTVYGVAMLASAARTIRLSAELETLSTRSGQSVEQLSTIRFALEQNDASLQDYLEGLKTLSDRIYDATQRAGPARDAFLALGISQEFLRENINKADVVFLALADRFSGMRDGAGKSALANDLLAGSAQRLLPTLNQGSQAIGDMTDEFRQFTEIGTDAAKQADQLGKNMSAIREVAASVGRDIANYFLPALVDITSEMRRAAKEGGTLDAIIAGLGSTFGKVFGLSSTQFEFADDRVNDLFSAIKAETDKLRKLEAQLNDSAGFPFRDSTLDHKIKKTRENIQIYKTELRDAVKFRDSLLTKPSEPEEKIDAPDKPLRRGRGEYFLDSLKEQIERVSQGEVAMLRLKAAHLGVAAAADPLIKKLIAAKVAQQELLDRQEARGRATDNEIDRLNRQELAHSDALDITNKHTRAKKDEIDQIRLSTSLIGESTATQRLTNEAARIDLEIRKESLTILPEYRDEFIKAAQAMRNEYLVALNESIEASRSFETGVKSALATYRDEATNTAAQTARVLSNGFRKAEDALVNFAKTGKLNFRDFTDSVITDLLRIQAQKAVLTFADSILSVASTPPGVTAGTQLSTSQATQLNDQWSIFDSLASLFGFHTGYGPGDAPTFVRQVPASILASAPRFHSGIGPGEQAAVIRRDESVLTPGQMRQLAPVGSGPVTVNQSISVTVESTGDSQADGEAIAARLRPAMRQMVVDVLVKEKRPGGMLT